MPCLLKKMINTEQNIRDSLTNSLAANLQPLYEPDSVQFSFDAVAWRVLFAVVSVLVLVLIFRIIRSYVRDAYRRRALVQVNKAVSNMEILIILKQLAMQVYGRERVASLYGESWLSFLDKTGKGMSFSEQEDKFLNIVYNSDSGGDDIEPELLLGAKKWIRTHARKL